MSDKSSNDRLSKFRDTLQQTADKMQEFYDKSVITLSGASLGISLTFYKDIVQKNPHHNGILVCSWIFWTLSIVATLVSYYISRKAFQKAVEQLDAGKTYKEELGGAFAKWNEWLGLIAGASFILGIVFFAVFVGINFQ